MTKTCTKCQVEKSLGEFHKSKKGKFGVRSICKRCTADYKKSNSKVYQEVQAKRKQGKEKDLLAEHGMKICTTCQLEKTIDNYSKSKRNRGGFSNKCKTCKKEYDKAYTKKNKEKISKRRKKYYKTIKKHKKEYDKVYREKNKERYAEQKKQYYQKNKEKLKKYYKKYRKENAEKISAHKRQKVKDMPAGLYQIINKINKLVYIGQSTQIPKRWSQHKNKLRSGKHKNGLLQEEYNKYGEGAFEFEIIKEYPPDTLGNFLEKEETKLILENHNKGIPMYNLSIKISSIEKNP